MDKNNHLVSSFLGTLLHDILLFIQHRQYLVSHKLRVRASKIKTQFLLSSCIMCTYVFTFTRCRSIGFIMVPWKNSTVVKCRLNRPSNSKSGGFLFPPNFPEQESFGRGLSGWFVGSVGQERRNSIRDVDDVVGDKWKSVGVFFVFGIEIVQSIQISLKLFDRKND